MFQIIGCALEVLNVLGHGTVEKPYENALVVEFGTPTNSIQAAAGIRGSLQRPEGRHFSSRSCRLQFHCRGHQGHRSDHQSRTWVMLNSLRITNLRVGVILNFKHRKLEWERMVL
jgi:hypothetical protein